MMSPLNIRDLDKNGEYPHGYFDDIDNIFETVPLIFDHEEDIKRNEEIKNQKLEKVVQMLGISPRYHNNLKDLWNYKIIALVDDFSFVERNINPSLDPSWSEIQEALILLLYLTHGLDETGLDIHLSSSNRTREMREESQLEGLFNDKGDKGLSLFPSIGSLLEQCERNEEPIILVIFTNRIPCLSEKKVPAGQAFNEYMKDREENLDLLKKLAFNFVVYSEDPNVLSYYRNLHGQFRGMNMREKYLCEKDEVERIFSGNRSLSKGDWLVKILLGGINRHINFIDAVPRTCSCVIS
ncbi:hypothetical protein SCG7109_AA_00220 [Chlamydiales bacterium SCGC AG-110-M15]|nr:hypothetical protein SCG7109_AA_00220 [Chlamydiales bacterium SCGC AG-110-M15]